MDCMIKWIIHDIQIYTKDIYWIVQNPLYMIIIYNHSVMLCNYIGIIPFIQSMSKTIGSVT